MVAVTDFEYRWAEGRKTRAARKIFTPTMARPSIVDL
jgi:hypothetical protein